VEGDPVTAQYAPSEFVLCIEAAMTFEPSLDMKRRLDKNKETFTQYVVRLLSYPCNTCLAVPGMACCLRIATSKSCGVQFHRSRARLAKCPVTKQFFEPELE
jgi:hypothetical protein